MLRKLNMLNVSIIIMIFLLIIITISGLLSFDVSKSYNFTNIYGDSIKIFGNGVYKYDSYFKAPIFIGTDFIMLVVVVPLLIISLYKNIKQRTIKTKLALVSIIGVIVYYATSISFGVTYNELHLLYIALFSISLFDMFILISDINKKDLRDKQKLNLPTKGITIFLILAGASLFFAWLPDIITSLVSNKSLALIENYTTEITYVIDMGVISPLAIICLYYLKKKNGVGDIIFTILLKACIIIGIILLSQSIFQIIAGIDIPIPALITKIGVFILFSVFAIYFNNKYYKNIEKRNWTTTRRYGK